MRHHDNCTPIFFQLVFQELYGFIVNVVGWFVQQQDITGLNPCRRNASSSPFSARKCTDVAVYVGDAKLLQNRFGFKFFCRLQICWQVCHDLFQDAAMFCKVWNLRQVRNPDAFGADDRSAVRFFHTGKNPQQGRFSRPVDADNANSVAFVEKKRNVIQDGSFQISF